jgi:hypothetical protein
MAVKLFPADGRSFYEKLAIITLGVVALAICWF